MTPFTALCRRSSWATEGSERASLISMPKSYHNQARNAIYFMLWVIYQNSGAKDKKLLIVPQADHNDVMIVDQDLYFKTIGEFVRTYS
jgi:hypothetical protein